MTRNKKSKNQRKEAALEEWLQGGGRGDESVSEVSKDSGTQQQINQINKTLGTLLERFNQLTVNHETNKHTLETSTQGLAQAQQVRSAIPEPTMGQLLYVFHEDSIQNRFMQASSLLKPLNGNEGRTLTEAYFSNFEAITYGWSDTRRAALLATHLVDQAKLTYASLSDRDRKSYETVKEYIIQRYTNTNAVRTRAQNEVLAGIRQLPKESLLDWGLRILRTVRDSVMPGVPEEAIEDMAATHLLRYIGDPLIYSSLLPNRQNMTYHQLLDQAVTLKEMNEAAGYGTQSRGYASQWPRNSNNFSGNRSNGNRFTPIVQNQGQRQFIPPHHTTNNDFKPYSQNPPQNQQSATKPINSQTRFIPNQAQNAQQRNPRVTGVDVRNARDAMVDELIGLNQNSTESADGGGGNYCPAVISGTNTGDANGSCIQSKSGSTQIVPVHNPPEKGLTHRMIDLDGICPDILIGTPKGPQPIVQLKAHGVTVDCLADAGAEINLISIDCIKYIIKTAQLDPYKMNFHPPANPVCKAANQSLIHFLTAVSLPIEREGSTIWIEVQVPKTPPPKPVVLGTNGLMALGYDVVDTLTGKYLLSGKSSMLTCAESQENATPVLADDSSVVAAYSLSIGQASAKVPDGSYLLTSMQEEFLVQVEKGKLSIPLSNMEATPETIEAAAVVGQLSGIEEVFTSTDIIVSTVTEELIQQGVVSASEDGKDIWLHIPYEKIISPEQENELEALVREYSDVFVMKSSEIGHTSLVKHHIEVSDSRPIKHCPRPVPYALREKVAEMVQDYLEKGVIRPSMSPYSNPVVLVRKKDGSLRFCIDYRRLNAITKKDAYPVPNIDSILLTIGKPHFFASLDVKDAYWHIPLDEESMEKTAFPTPQGLYEWKVMPLGLANAPATFQRFMQRVLQGLPEQAIRAYFDDILIVSKEWDGHLSHLRTVFDHFRQAGIKLKPNKCKLVAKEIEFLGHKLTREGLRKDELKVKAIKEFPVPTNLKQLRSFLGLSGYYRKFIAKFADVARPLYDLTKDIQAGKDFLWSPTCQRAFEELINRICEDVTLEFPDFESAMLDPARSLVIQTDASRSGIAGILGQLDGQGKSRPIYFASRACSDAESKYSVTELEALALKVFTLKFDPYSSGLKVIVETDHAALVPIFNKAGDCQSARINKWAMLIKSKYDLEVRYRTGKSNASADALSRMFDKGVSTLAIISAVSRPIQAYFPSNNKKDEWVSAQVDGEFGDIYQFLDTHMLPPEDEKAQQVISRTQSFTIVGRILYFVDPSTSELRLVVPTQFQHTVFHERHSGVCGVHQSARKIHLALKKLHYWPNMRGDIEKWVRSCPICAFTREPRLNLPPLQPIIAEAPFDLLCLDILQLGPTPKGNKYLLVMVDHFSKLLIAEPLKSKSAEEVVTALLDRVVLVHGVPRRIHSNKGREFVNTTVEQLAKVLGTEQSTTSGYNPRANGAAERANREIVRMLRRSCIVQQEWDDRIQFVVFAYNATPHESTGESPYFIIHGRDANFPSEVDPQLVPKMYADAHGFKEMVAENVNEVAKRVQVNLEKARANYKKHYDAAKKTLKEKYSVGQRVMLYNPQPDTSPNRKLNWRFYGPFRIIEVEGSNAKVRPVDKPHMKGEWVPLDRLGPIPEECSLKYEGKDPRKKLLRGSQAGCIVENSLPEIQIIRESPSIVFCASETTSDPNERIPQTSTAPNRPQEHNSNMERRMGYKHVAFISMDLTLLKIIDGDSFAAEVFIDMSSLGLLFLNTIFESNVEEVLVFLSTAQGMEYVVLLEKVIEHAKGFPATKFYFVPPPPVVSSAYDRAMDLFIDLFTQGNLQEHHQARETPQEHLHYRLGFWRGECEQVPCDGGWVVVEGRFRTGLRIPLRLHWHCVAV